MENVMWIDLGLIGHKSKRLTEIFRSDYLVDVSMRDDYTVDYSEWNGDKFVVFIDYTIGGSGETGTKVFTNAFEGERNFFKELSHKLIKEYVEINKPLDFKQDF
jgi:hypothetical protein